MTAFNIVRVRVKPGQEQKFLDVHRQAAADYPGFRRAVLVKTGDRSYCFVGEWDDRESIRDAEEDMVKVLDRFRDTLEDLGGGLGVTDPASGEVVLEITPG
jgi:heme-degrading monooxygenase HmoA